MVKHYGKILWFKSARKHVDHYFSDENLRTDNFLLSKMHGRDNLPVPLHVIHTFKKLQRFTFAEVVEALSHSQVVKIVDKDKVVCIQRKTPFIKPDKLKSGSKSKKSRGTGFEEYWADAPLAPDEFKEEEELYSADLHFAGRIETAIQRYQKKRKLNSFAANVLTKWLKYGGFKTGPKQFTGGLDMSEIDSKTASEIATMTATTYAGEDKLLVGKDAVWEVDFENVAKGFLSSAAPHYFELDTLDRTKQCVNILRNFYNYVLYHNVCPEYSEQIYAARRACDLADKELFQTYKACHGRLSLPGDFNSACSCIFGDRGMRGDTSWAQDYESKLDHVSYNNTDARQVLTLGHAAHADLSLFSQDEYEYMKQLMPQEVVDIEEDIGLEVTAIEFADDRAKAAYKDYHDSADRESHQINATGKLICKSWTPPDFAEMDLPAGASTAKPQSKSYEFWIEEEILHNCFVGMKIEGTVHTLTSGLEFLDGVTAVRCSFYTLLENELSAKWRDPRYFTREEYLARAKGGDQEYDGPNLNEMD